MTTQKERIEQLEQRAERLDRAVRALSIWVHQTAGGLGLHDVVAIERILDGEAEDADG